jgi:hypothetical protein
MKLIVKILPGKQFDIDVDIEDSVEKVKQLIQKENDIDVSMQRLILLGK